MARERITDADVEREFRDVAQILNQDLGMPMPTLHYGATSYKISNKLIIDNHNVWPDHMAGCSKRDAYNALRVMKATLGAVVDHQDTVRRARARTGL